MREIKFRAWVNRKQDGYMTESFGLGGIPFVVDDNGFVDLIPMQYTGLKDKNGLQEVYEGDIIDEYGKIKGNTYEMDAGETDFIIQGFGDKNWGKTYKEAVERGCADTQRYADTDEVRKLD